MAVIFQTINRVQLQVVKAGQKVPVTLVDITDLKTLETGVATPTIEISKNGAAYAAPNDGTWAEIANGDYTVTLDDADTDTIGWILLRVEKSTVTAETRVFIEVSIDAAEQAAMAERIRVLRRTRQ
jgi:hypothetical protein